MEKKLYIAMQVLNEVSVEFPDTKEQVKKQRASTENIFYCVV